MTYPHIPRAVWSVLVALMACAFPLCLTKSDHTSPGPPVQAFLTKLLTVDLPGLMVLPKRLEVNIPPSLTSVAEAAVGRDAVMRAVASAVLQVSAPSFSSQLALP